MPYDSERYIEAPSAQPAPERPKHNMDKLIERLESLDAHEYDWTDPRSCVIGHARQLRQLMYRESCRGSDESTYDWMGVAAADGQQIFVGELGAKHLRTPKQAVAHLRSLIADGKVAGYPPAPVKPSLFTRIFSAFQGA